MWDPEISLQLDRAVFLGRVVANLQAIGKPVHMVTMTSKYCSSFSEISMREYKNKFKYARRIAPNERQK